MATPIPRTLQPPPDLPHDPKTSDVLTAYLRTFSLWCRHGFADKLSQTTAAPGLILQATDDPAKIFMIQVNAAGTISATVMPLGGGQAVTIHPYHRKLARVLDRMGGLYNLNDILSEIAANKMQSWVEGESWALTRIAIYPRCKVVEVLAVVGKIDEARVLHDRILIFAAEIGAKVIQAYGRKGWLHDAERRGWKVMAENYVYQRDVDS